jgi:hypothetical protein
LISGEEFGKQTQICCLPETVTRLKRLTTSEAALKETDNPGFEKEKEEE